MVLRQLDFSKGVLRLTTRNRLPYSVGRSVGR
jgi:hypothetical protein